MSDQVQEGAALSLAEEADVAAAAVARHQFLATAPVGSVRPADGLEARVARLEALLRSQIAADVLTPEDAQEASVVQDNAAADAAAAAEEADGDEDGKPAKKKSGK